MTHTITLATTGGKTARPKIAANDVTDAQEMPGEKTVTAAKQPRKSKRPVDSDIGPEERHHLIAVAAYYLALNRGFHGEGLHDDWLAAEREIDAMIAARKFRSG